MLYPFILCQMAQCFFVSHDNFVIVKIETMYTIVLFVLGYIVIIDLTLRIFKFTKDRTKN